MQNSQGSITFHPKNPKTGGIDITCVDLRDVQILNKEVVVYRQFEEQNQHLKPKCGEKLNVPATICLNNMRPPKGKTAEAFSMLLKRSLEKDSQENLEKDEAEKAIHISYNQQACQWIFRVPHF